MGILFFNTTGIITNWILPAILDIPFFNGIGPIFFIILAYIVFYSISRYRFLDLKLWVMPYVTNAVLITIYVTIGVITYYITSNIFIIFSVYFLLLLLFTFKYQQITSKIKKILNYIFYFQEISYYEEVKQKVITLEENIKDTRYSLTQKLKNIFGENTELLIPQSPGVIEFFSFDDSSKNKKIFHLTNFSEYLNNALLSKDEIDYRIEMCEEKDLNPLQKQLNRWNVNIVIPIQGKYGIAALILLKNFSEEKICYIQELVSLSKLSNNFSELVKYEFINILKRSIFNSVDTQKALNKSDLNKM